jgi:squalene-hopene/tetraprenyl-beta-curcumene cyclase
MTMTSATSQIDQLTAGAALERAVVHLQSRQHAEGWWKGALDTNVTMDAEDLLLREFLGIREAQETAEAARWIRSRQREDGTWATFYGGPPDLSTTVEAWVALRLAGDVRAELTAIAEFITARTW